MTSNASAQAYGDKLARTHAHHRVLLIAFGAVIALVGSLCGSFGGFLAATDGPDTWIGSSFAQLETPAYAFVTDASEITDTEGEGGNIRVAHLRTLAAGAEPLGPGGVFVGVGPEEAVRRYLSDVHQAELTDIDFPPLRIEQRLIPGTRAPAPPAEQPFWTASAAGPGRQVIKWKQARDERLVVMNADASPGVDARLAFSSGIEYFDVFWLVLAAIGVIALASGLAIIAANLRPPPSPPPA